VSAGAKDVGADGQRGAANCSRPTFRPLHQQPSRSDTSAGFLNHEAAKFRCAVAFQRPFDVDMNPTGESQIRAACVWALGNEYGMSGIGQDLSEPVLDLLVRRRVAQMTAKASESARIAESRWANAEANSRPS